MILSFPNHFLLKRDRGKREIRGKSKRSQPCFRVFRVFRGYSLLWLRLRLASPRCALCVELSVFSRMLNLIDLTQSPQRSLRKRGRLLLWPADFLFSLRLLREAP